jgi:hypothetical protein
MMVPGAAPASAGVKVTDTEHENPAPNVAGDKGQLVALTVKPADTLIPEIVRGIPLLFISVNIDAEEGDPTADWSTWLTGLSVCANAKPVIDSKSIVSHAVLRRASAENHEAP